MQIENCPICGSDSVSLMQETSGVICGGCGLMIVRDTVREAVEAWNTRRQGGKKRVKIEQISGLRLCPMCSSEAVMRKNASKRFQVKCKKCSCATAWTDKVNAVVLWYNNAAFYEQQKGGKDMEAFKQAVEEAQKKPEQERTPEEKLMLKALEEAKANALKKLKEE